MPQTDALREQTLLNLANDPIQAWYYSRLQDGNTILSGAGDTTLYPWSETDTVWVPVRAVVADYTAFAKRHGKPGDDHRLAPKLARYMPEGFGSKNKREEGRIDKAATKHYPFPPLTEARRLFAKATGHDIADAADEPEDGGAAA